MSSALFELAGPQRLVALVTQRFTMADDEAEALAAIGGLVLNGPFHGFNRSFHAQLEHTILRYGLHDLFRYDGPGQHHHIIRPSGYDYHRDEVHAEGMERWRADYRAMTTTRQMMAATVIWLYRGGKDNRWLRRVPCTWQADEALSHLGREGALEDWLRLVVLYPGW